MEVEINEHLNYFAGSNPNSLLTVHDHTDLTTLLSPRTSSSPPSSSDEYIPSSSYLAASWNVTVHQGLKPNRCLFF